MSAGSTTNTTCYNTITTNTNVVAVPTTNVRPLRPPSLPDGQIIDGKNTLQSFIASPTSERLTSNKMLYSNVANENDPVVNINGVNGMTTGFTPNTMATRTTTGTTNDDTPIHAEAIPVRSLAVVVDAEIADVGPPPWNVNGKDEHHHHHAKPRSVLFWLLNLLAMMLVGAVVGVSVYCGTGNCGTRSSTGRSISRSSPTPTPTVKVTPPPNVPIAAVVTNVPVVPPIIAVESFFFFLCRNIVYSLTASATHGRSICDCAAIRFRVDREKFPDVLCQWLVALEADALIYEWEHLFCPESICVFRDEETFF